jgi:hypothetical protein
MCLENDFDEASTETLQSYLKTKKKEDLQNDILACCSKQVQETPDEYLTKDFGLLNGIPHDEDDFDEEA